MSDPEIDIGKQRSPTYPYISLDLAVERTGKLFEQVRDTAQPREVMAKAYGKPATSSATMQTFATLTQYGLLEPVLHLKTGSGVERRLRVTQLARSLINPNAPPEVVAKGCQMAALKPTIFRELWDKYGTTLGLNDSVILYYLTTDREQSVFTDRAAQEVLRVYRATMAYAGLSESDKDDPSDGSDPEVETDKPEASEQREVEDRSSPPPPTREREKLVANERELTTGLLSKDASFRLIVTGAIGVKEIERLIAKLEIDKEILAESDEEPDEE